MYISNRNTAVTDALGYATESAMFCVGRAAPATFTAHHLVFDMVKFMRHLISQLFVSRL